VVFHGRDGAARSSVRKEIELAGGGAMRVSGEVKSFSDIEAARLQIEGELGLVDIFVANLGGSFTPPPAQFKTRANKDGARLSTQTSRRLSLQLKAFCRV